MNIFEDNFREKATQHKSVLRKPQDKLQVLTQFRSVKLVCNRKQGLRARTTPICLRSNETSLSGTGAQRWSGQTRTKCTTRMTVLELTDAVSWSAARVEHSKHAERWQPQRGVPLPHSYPLSHSSLHRPGVSGSGSARSAPLRVAWQIHWGFGYQRWRWIEKWIKNHMSQMTNHFGPASEFGDGTSSRRWRKTRISLQAASLSPGELHGEQLRLHRFTNHNATTPWATTPLQHSLSLSHSLLL